MKRWLSPRRNSSLCLCVCMSCSAYIRQFSAIQTSVDKIPRIIGFKVDPPFLRTTKSRTSIGMYKIGCQMRKAITVVRELFHLVNSIFVKYTGMLTKFLLLLHVVRVVLTLSLIPICSKLSSYCVPFRLSDRERIFCAIPCVQRCPMSAPFLRPSRTNHGFTQREA